MGEIVAVDADGITVVCADGRFKVLRVQADGPKLAAGEWAKTAGLATGVAAHMIRFCRPCASGDPVVIDPQ